MIISLGWLKDFVDVNASSQEIADRLSVSGLEVEHLYPWQSVQGGLRGFVIGEVVECAKHPNADKLSITKVNIGNGELQPIVCGAPNVAAGQKVVVATPGTEVTVPGKGTFVIGEAKIRGEISRGMICAEDETGLGNSHDGIMVLPQNARPGTAAAEYFGIVTDEVLEIGLTPNRGDAASHLGVARDVAALFETEVKRPSISGSAAAGKYQIIIENEGDCVAYIALTVVGLTAHTSPGLVQNRLKTLNIEPKNILIDSTNYTLHALGQPVHAFDADKISGNTLTVRRAREGEKLVTLDKVERVCKGGELLIADDSGPVAFAGVMGGLNTAVTENTKNVLIESAAFNSALVRKTAKLHGLSTDASFRFERGTDPEICRLAAFYTAELMTQSGGSIIGENAFYAPKPEVKIEYNHLQLCKFAGVEIPEDQVVRILENLGFSVSGDRVKNVKVPSWRNDVHAVVDLYEEVMRIFGYDNIPLSGKMSASLPRFSGTAVFRKQEHISRFLISRGFFEIINNSLSSGRYYTEAERQKLVEISNPLSSDLQYMRGSLLPGMLQSAAYNRNRKEQNIRFFEFGRTYSLENGEIKENDTLGILINGNENNESWEMAERTMDYYFGKQIVKGLLESVGCGLETELYNISQVSAAYKNQFDLNGDWWYCEINLAKLLWRKAADVRVMQPPKFPLMRRDLSFVVNKATPFSDLQKAIEAQKLALLKNLTVFDVFEGKPLEADQKAIAVAFYLGKEDETLTDEMADTAMNQLISACEKMGATIRR